MKRIMSITLILICVMSLVGCGRSMNDVIGKEPDFVGIVQEVTGDYLIVNVNEDDVVYKNCPVVQVPLDVEIKDSYLDYSVGDEVVVYYDGNIKDGNPAIVNKVYALTLRTPANREQNAIAPDKCLDEVAGNITFYEKPVKESQNGNGTVTVSLSRDLNEEQADKLKEILDDVDEWVDDHSVDRLAYYFDGDFELSDREHSYYFTYEYNVIYYDHYFAEIPAEDMQYIKDLGAESDEFPDVEPTKYTNYYNIEEEVELCKGTADEKTKVTVKFQSTEGPSTFAVEVWHRASENDEWTKSESKSALVGDAPAFTVPAASEYVVMVTAIAGNKGNVTFLVSCS